MNVKILLIAIASVSLGSCSTAYRSGQTPDDVYFSPVRAVEEDTRKEERREERVDAEEREIRMASRDRRWRNWDNDYDCRYDPYRYGYSYGGYYYNPYYYPYPVYSGYGWAYVNPKNTTPRMANLAGYNPKSLVVSNPKTGETKWVNSPKVYNNSNNSNSRNSGGFVRKVLNSNSSSERTGNNRTYTPSSNSSSSGKSSSGGAPVSRPARRN
ncbi:MAG: hypothetical protein EOO03_07180 [Chitinophagaceae bacterium]|nr:MAG: hypothetical protein EOO03_07180 [Chitinophagaceae bacterium]